MDLEQNVCCIGLEVLIFCHKNVCHIRLHDFPEKYYVSSFFRKEKEIAGNLFQSATGSRNALLCLEPGHHW